jgi:cyclase
MERNQITDRIVQFAQPGTFMPACLTAFAGDDGLLLVDAGMVDQSDALRAAVEQLGFESPTYIVNTHAHPGNIGGNGAFGTEPTIIAHRGVREQMQADSHLLLELSVEALPDREIDSDTELRFNGTTVRMLPLPGGHTPHDLIVHFPDLGVACLGDIYPGRFFPASAYGARLEDYPGVLRRVLETLPEDTKLLFGHQPGVGGMDDLRESLEVFDEVLPPLKEGILAGKERPELEAALPERWADYGIPGGALGNWIFCLRRDLQEAEQPPAPRASILRPMYDAQKTGGGDAIVDRMRQEIAGGLKIVPEHEPDLIQFGYWLMRGKERPQDALPVFAFGVELFPDAWNTYDSLAEAYAVLGERDQAIRHYRKSLELNPENANGVAELAKLDVE